jgi:hypothetical protein
MNRTAVRRDDRKARLSGRPFIGKSRRIEIVASDPKQNAAKDKPAEKPKATNSDLPETELAQVAGGFNPQPEPPGDKVAARLVSLPAEKLLRGN